MMSRLLHRVHELPARLLAGAACALADLAVGVHHGVAMAFVAGAPAAGDARLKQRPGDVGVVLGLPAYDLRGGRADVCAVKAQPDALDQLRYFRFAQVIIGVGGASLSAVGERVDRIGEHLGVDVEGARLAVQQLACVAHGPPYSSGAAPSYPPAVGG